MISPGISLLLIAAGHKEALELMVEHGSDINARTFSDPEIITLELR